MKIFYFIATVFLLASCNSSNKEGQQSELKDSVLVQSETISAADTGESSDDEENNCGYKFIFESIDKKTYENLYSKYYKEYKPTKITDFDSVKKLLSGIVEWVEEETEDEEGNPIRLGHTLKINFRNGSSRILLDNEHLQSIKEHGWETIEHTSFVVYFPGEDILLLSEENYGDGGDQSYNLTTGDTKETAGDPKYTYFSPNGKHRVRGYYNGYVMVYNYQEKQGKHYVNLCPVEVRGEISEKIFFTDDSTFYFEHHGDLDSKHYKKATIQQR